MNKILKKRQDRIMNLYIFWRCYTTLETRLELQIAYDYWHRHRIKLWDPFWQWVVELLNSKIEIKAHLLNLAIKRWIRL